MKRKKKPNIFRKIIITEKRKLMLFNLNLTSNILTRNVSKSFEKL